MGGGCAIPPWINPLNKGGGVWSTHGGLLQYYSNHERCISKFKNMWFFILPFLNSFYFPKGGFNFTNLRRSKGWKVDVFMLEQLARMWFSNFTWEDDIRCSKWHTIVWNWITYMYLKFRTPKYIFNNPILMWWVSLASGFVWEMFGLLMKMLKTSYNKYHNG